MISVSGSIRRPWKNCTCESLHFELPRKRKGEKLSSRLWLRIHDVNGHEFVIVDIECWTPGKIQSFPRYFKQSQRVIPKLNQVSALPRTLILLLLFLTAFIWISAILMLIMAARLKWIYWDVAQSFSLRLAITVFTIILVYSVGQMNVVSWLNFSAWTSAESSHTFLLH